jgi:hypothetical protein
VSREKVNSEKKEEPLPDLPELPVKEVKSEK